ncbi:ABC transporter ATP-binding protein [Nocardioides alcanivorans]|uniref:ABC transporter ATP-binding protein n=1 Tax=Nocardioides alcanivorans TaxID=2897352 RepID=UPI001F42A685|nr:ABC transporter ATP-binding protein [Nocardioides alcanivorans]
MNATMSDPTTRDVTVAVRPAISVADLSIEVDARDTFVGRALPLVRHVSFEVAPGEMVGLAGESGSGKSLTASAVAGLLPEGVRQAGGDIQVMGRAPGAGRRRDSDVAMIFQNPMTSLNPSMRIGDQIAEAVRLRHKGMSRKESRRRAVEILDRVEVNRPAERARQYPFEFSGGMRQRAMIGIAVAREPSVLIADEPTTALDVTVQKGVMDLLDRLRAEMGLAVLLISHDLGVISERCDRVLVMYSGELVEIGTTRQVLDSPLHPYVDGLMRCIPERALELGSLQPLPGQVPGPEAHIPGCRFADRCAFVTDECRQAPVPMADAGPGREVRCLRWQELSAARVADVAQLDEGGVR